MDRVSGYGEGYKNAACCIKRAYRLSSHALLAGMFTGTFEMLAQQQLTFFEHSTQVMRNNKQHYISTLFANDYLMETNNE